MKNKLILWLFFLWMIPLATSCVTQTPTPQYAERYAFSAVYTHDDTTDLTSSAVNEDVIAAINDVLTARNLRVTPISFGAIESQMTAIRDTDRRLQALKASSLDSSFILLTEISTEFYSALSGRYRWDVNVHLAVYDRVTRETLNDKFTVPVALMYAHETGDDAIASAQAEIARRVGGLVDSFLKGRALKSAAVVPAASDPENHLPERIPASLGE